MTKTLIAGNDPICEDAAKQYTAQGRTVQRCGFAAIPDNLPEYDELFVAETPTADDEPFAFDSTIFGKLKSKLAGSDHKILCQLLLHSQESYRAFLTNDLEAGLAGTVEFWPFTKEDSWAQRMLASFRDKSYPALDRTPINAASEATVHLVLFGMTRYAEALARTAALVCHYPNYCRDHSLRTRITIIDEDTEPAAAGFVSRHASLLQNSFVRHINVSRRECRTDKPQYYGRREDFVDIEWEFVTASPASAAIKEKLQLWAADDRQILTLAICLDNDEKNYTLARELSGTVPGTPVFAKTEDDAIYTNLTASADIHPFGMEGVCHDIALPLRKMAMIVNSVYNNCYAQAADKAIAPAEVDLRKAEAEWSALSSPLMKWSSVFNAMALGCKMHSLGHDESDWSTYYCMSDKEIEVMAETEHNRWSVERLVTGFRPVTDEEQRAVETDSSQKKVLKARKIHYDLRSYSDLRNDETGKNVNIYDICLSAATPLIANAANIFNK